MEKVRFDVASEANIQAQREREADLLKAAANAGAMLGAVYDFVDQIDKLGGATSIAGIAKCHAMLTSLKSNRARAETLVMAPLREALEAAKPKATSSGSLLREPGPLPPGCHCKDICMAPVIMGQQASCRREGGIPGQKAPAP